MNDDEKSAGNELKARVCRVIELSITCGERIADITAYVKDADSETFGMYSKDKKTIDLLYNAWKDCSRVIIDARARYEFPWSPRVLYDVEKIERFEEAEQ